MSTKTLPRSSTRINYSNVSSLLQEKRPGLHKESAVALYNHLFDPRMAPQVDRAVKLHTFSVNPTRRCGRYGIKPCSTRKRQCGALTRHVEGTPEVQLHEEHGPKFRSAACNRKQPPAEEFTSSPTDNPQTQNTAAMSAPHRCRSRSFATTATTSRHIIFLIPSVGSFEGIQHRGGHGIQRFLVWTELCGCRVVAVVVNSETRYGGGMGWDEMR